ncbi:MAG TPA: phosphatase PAP2 family protein [Acidimicrobiales bacterium]|nr:phosphatase PAP2 family protein [Acidimicrobiales bacterium]
MALFSLFDRSDTRVTAFDDWVEELVEQRLRHRPAADMVMYGASFLGDHGVLWMILAGAQAVRNRDGDWRRPLARALLGLAAESIVVNGPIKAMFRRTRPIAPSVHPLRLRTPRTSSFPSGHASAAFFGAALLRDDDPWWPAYYVVAVIVAMSRLHVRIHHASDVVAGAVIGTLLGELTRVLIPLPPREAASLDMLDLHPDGERRGARQPE